MRRFGLRDDEWDRIKELLPGRKGSVGVTAVDNRLFVEAVLYRYRTSTPFSSWVSRDSQAFPYQPSAIPGTRMKPIAGQVKENPTCCALTAAGGQEGIDDGILDVAVPEPILHKAQIGAGFEQMGGDRVLETMEVALRRREIGGLAVALHQPVERAARDRIAPVAREQDGGWRRGPLAQVGPQGLGLIRLHRMHPGMTALQAMNPEAQRPEIEIIEAHQPDFAGAQAVAVGDQEQRAIAEVTPHDRKQPGELVEGEEADRLGGRAAIAAG